MKYQWYSSNNNITLPSHGKLIQIGLKRIRFVEYSYMFSRVMRPDYIFFSNLSDMDYNYVSYRSLIKKDNVEDTMDKIRTWRSLGQKA